MEEGMAAATTAAGAATIAAGAATTAVLATGQAEKVRVVVEMTAPVVDAVEGVTMTITRRRVAGAAPPPRVPGRRFHRDGLLR